MSEKSFAALFQAAEKTEEYWTQRAIVQFTEELSRRMEEKGVSRAELAAAIGVSQPYITKVLKGNVNFTLATMTKLAMALGAVLRIQVVPMGEEQVARMPIELEVDAPEVESRAEVSRERKRAGGAR
jgi:predicted transcriptional regulator